MNRYLAALAAFCLVVFLLPVPPSDAQEKLKPTNLDKVNTPGDEDDPHLTSTGLILLYTSVNKGRSEVMISKRSKKDSPWLAGKVLPELKERADVKSVFLTPDGRYPQHLYFATNYDPEVKDTRGDNYDIYYLIRQGAGAEFTTKTAVISVCTAVDERHPRVTADDR
jgi:hypothetical protein